MTPPPPQLRQIQSPAPSETETNGGGSVLLSPLVITQMVEMITQAMRGEMQQMGSKIDGVNKQMETSTNEMKTNACRMNNNMEANTQSLRGEMQRMGLDLQVGQGALKEELKCLQAGIMAMPRAGGNELRGSATAVTPAMEAGEDKVIRETCWARSVKVTEKVTVTAREKLNGVTETCTRHIEAREISEEVTEIIETRRWER